MKLRRRLVIIGVLLLVCSLVAANQYVIIAMIRTRYSYSIIHHSDANIRFIGSDNMSDGKRILRMMGSNDSSGSLTLRFGNYSINSDAHYTAAFGMVNEEKYSINITHINVTSSNNTYLKIWLHGDRDTNANSTSTDPSNVFMYNNGTIVNKSSTIAWTLAAGDQDPSTMCSNVTDRIRFSSDTKWDNRANVRYSVNDTNAVRTWSDYVWVQVTISIPSNADIFAEHTGYIVIHYSFDV